MTYTIHFLRRIGLLLELKVFHLNLNSEKDENLTSLKNKFKKDNISPICVAKGLNCWQVIMSSRSAKT